MFWDKRTKEEKEADNQRNEQKKFYSEVERQKKREAELDRLKGEAEARQKSMKLQQNINKHKQAIKEAKSYEFRQTRLGKALTIGEKVGGNLVKRVAKRTENFLLSKPNFTKKRKKIKVYRGAYRHGGQNVVINQNFAEPNRVINFIQPRQPSFMPRQENLPPMPDILGTKSRPLPNLLGKGSRQPKMLDLFGTGHKRRTGRKTNIFRLY